MLKNNAECFQRPPLFRCHEWNSRTLRSRPTANVRTTWAGSWEQVLAKHLAGRIRTIAAFRPRLAYSAEVRGGYPGRGLLLAQLLAQFE